MKLSGPESAAGLEHDDINAVMEKFEVAETTGYLLVPFRGAMRL